MNKFKAIAQINAEYTNTKTEYTNIQRQNIQSK